MSDPVPTNPPQVNPPEGLINNKFPNLAKLLSGRFILTVVGAFCFYLIVDTICQLAIEKKDEIKITDILPVLSTVLIVVSNIFTFYFAKNGIGTKENPNGSKPGTEE